MPDTPLAELALEGIILRGPMLPGFDEILTPDAFRFLAMLHRRFERKRQSLLRAREMIEADLDDGRFPDFLDETAAIRSGDWSVEPVPDDLQDRRVEITGPVERKMIIHALNSGAQVFMADFEDATSPTWENVVRGQCNLYDAVRRTIEVRSERDGSTLKLNPTTAVLVVRPRGWHLPEWHVVIDGRPMSASLFDFGLYFFHNAKTLLASGTGPYFYLPKLENHLEARLWNEVFTRAQRWHDVPVGSIKATVLIETILAAFEMDEILFALREHAAGLNCGRWDYIFSTIKKFRAHPRFVLPDRSKVTMDRHFLRSYTQLVVKTCHRRGAHAIGGMAAQIPVKADPEAHRLAMEKVIADKTREVHDGHDGTWVAHPALVPIVRAIFDEGMRGPNQLFVSRADVEVSAQDLLDTPSGPVTESGVRLNIDVGMRYLEAWLRGQGCVPIYNLMEDAATAEISRSQLWQWIRHHACLEDGRVIDARLYGDFRDDVVHALRADLGEERWGQSQFEQAIELLDRLVLSPQFTPFLTLPAYDRLLKNEGAR
ncbi:MAG: malate synthase A [Gemmatimonadota bacterium]